MVDARVARRSGTRHGRMVAPRTNTRSHRPAVGREPPRSVCKSSPMPSRSGPRPPWAARLGWWFVGGTLVVLILVASNAGVFRGFEPADVSRGDALVRAAVGAAIGGLLAAVIQHSRRRDGERMPRVTARALTATLVSLFAIAAITTSPRTSVTGGGEGSPTVTTVVLPSNSTPDTGPPAEAPPPDSNGSSGDVGSGLMGVVIAFGLAAIIAIMLTYRRLRDDRPGRLAPWAKAPALPDDQTTIVDEVAAAASFAASARLLLDDPDPRRAVIAAYAALLDGLSVAGVPREPYEAPEEHLHRALVALHVPEDSAATVTDRFLRARFSRHEVTETDRRTALQALLAAERSLRDRQITV